MCRCSKSNTLVYQFNSGTFVQRSERNGSFYAIGTIGFGTAIIIEHDALAGWHFDFTIIAGGDYNHALQETLSFRVAVCCIDCVFTDFD